MHYGHDHDHRHHGAVGTGNLALPGHNGPPRPVQWQTPHRPEAPAAEERTPGEADLDLVERAFTDGFLMAADATSFLRLARVPFSARDTDGTALVLLRVELEATTDVGSITPSVGGGAFRYDPLPANAVSRRRRLRFVYFNGAVLRALGFEDVRRLQERSEDHGEPVNVPTPEALPNL